MDNLSQRIPTRGEVWTLFLVCVFPIHAWAVLMFLHEVPSYLLRMDLWDALGIFAYSQVFAFFESLIVVGAILFVCLALPSYFFRVKLVPLGAVFFLLSFVWLSPVHYQTQILTWLNWDMTIYQIGVALWIISYFLVVGGGVVLVFRKPSVEKGVNGFIERLVVLSVLYVLIDAISFLIVVYRNVV